MTIVVWVPRIGASRSRTNTSDGAPVTIAPLNTGVIATKSGPRMTEDNIGIES
jgi:hypothetical protein